MRKEHDAKCACGHRADQHWWPADYWKPNLCNMGGCRCWQFGPPLPPKEPNPSYTETSP